MATQTNLLANANVAEIELRYLPKRNVSSLPQITCSADSYALFLKSWDMDRLHLVEQFKMILLNRANRVLGIIELSTGGGTGTIADSRIIFAAALIANATSIIVSHNHPSGNLKPSRADIELTRKLREGGKLLDVAVLDHIIVTGHAYYSFADEGVI